MRILAIDTSCGATSVAVFDGEAQQTLVRESVVMTRGHAEALTPMVQRAIGEVEGGFGAIGRVAVGVGPGSFTGIRIGLAMARAISLTLETPIVGISTLVAFVGPLMEQPGPGVVASVIDARHGHVYFQLFESNGRPILAPRLTSLRDAVRLIGGGPARLAGDAAALVAEEALRGGVAFDASEAAPFPDIIALARIGLAADPETSPARPLYVKAPDAHPSLGDAVMRVGD
jgi:tRNA threonylcarbamoyladenosine biosynthesis protein TsaB